MFQYWANSVLLFSAYGTVKTKERGITETVPQLSVRGVG